MQAALSGYATIWIVIGVGALMAHLRVLGGEQRRMLSLLAFNVASPCLLFTLVARARLEHLFAVTLLVSVLAVLGAAALHLLANLVWFRRSLEDAVIGTLCSCYTNAGNLGLPIAAYVLGDMAWMAPIMLLQVGFVQPIGLTVLDAAQARREGRTISPLRYASLPFSNPITVGTLLGLLFNLAGWQIPGFAAVPLEMLGSMAVPAMLVAFGISLRLDPLPGLGPHLAELWAINLIKVLLHPVLAYLLGDFVFHLPVHDLLAVTVIAALPSAQNIYVIATRYDVRVLLARDAIFWSTILSIPVVVLASTLLR